MEKLNNKTYFKEEEVPEDKLEVSLQDEQKDHKLRTSRVIFLILGIFVLIVILGIGAYFYGKRSKKSRDEEAVVENDGQESEDISEVSEQGGEEQDSVEEEQTEEEERCIEDYSSVTWTDYAGEYLNAHVPQIWEFVEYVDGADPYGDKVENCTGLTAFEIKNSCSEPVFTISVIPAIGDPCICSRYYKFADFNEEDFLEMKERDDENESCDITTELIDLTSEEYQEYVVLGARVRRIGTELYTDRVLGNSFFEPACGISEMFINFDVIAYTFGLGSDYERSHSGYMWQIPEEVEESTLLVMDDVLSSLQAK